MPRTLTSRPQKLRSSCIQTGQPTKNGALFATQADRDAFQSGIRKDIEELNVQGFAQDPDVPNLFRRGSIAVTLEAYRVRRNQTMDAHAALEANRGAENRAGEGQADHATGS